VQKGPHAQIRVTLEAWRGQHKVGVREFSPGPIAGTFWPTAKGTTIELKSLPSLIAALQAAEVEARKRGLLQETIA
jgi:hypothetical protein